jgi:cysteine synthase A
LIACAQLLAEMKRERQRGAIVTLLCDGGERYLATCYDDAWLRHQKLDVEPTRATLTRFWTTGVWKQPAGVRQPKSPVLK